MAKKRKSVKRRKNFHLKGKIIFYSILTGFFLLGYFVFFHPNVSLKSEKYFLHVPANASSGQLTDSLKKKNITSSVLTFFLAAKLTGLEPRGGLYTLNDGWNNFQIIYHLNVDSIRPVVFVRVPVIRLRYDISKILCRDLSLKTNDFRTMLADTSFVAAKGFNKESVFAIFRPGKYRMYQDATIEELFERLHSEYMIFWNEDRLEKADSLFLTKEEVVTLASIVYSETKVVEEMPVIAGVYINRLKKRMRLESDPTLVFANKKFNLRRIFNKHKRTKSKYNTYRYKGLPPGPIITTPAVAIDAVLNYSRHNYFYFCAKGDLSGCHLFAPDFEGHKINARAYRKTLDRLKIK